MSLERFSGCLHNVFAKSFRTNSVSAGVLTPKTLIFLCSSLCVRVFFFMCMFFISFFSFFSGVSTRSVCSTSRRTSGGRSPSTTTSQPGMETQSLPSRTGKSCGSYCLRRPSPSENQFVRMIIFVVVSVCLFRLCFLCQKLLFFARPSCSSRCGLVCAIDATCVCLFDVREGKLRSHHSCCRCCYDGGVIVGGGAAAAGLRACGLGALAPSRWLYLRVRSYLPNPTAPSVAASRGSDHERVLT